MKRGEMLAKALVLATNAHDGQFDRGGKPYILHPLKVMSFLKEDDEELQCIALLHDVIEDSRKYNGELVTWKMLHEMGFTERVIAGIDSVTKRLGESDDEYRMRVFSNVDGMKVKQCDLQHNSDIRRLKNKVLTEKDIARTIRYQEFYLMIDERLSEKGINDGKTN